MKREKADKSDKLDVSGFTFSLKNCLSRKKSRSNGSKTRIILSSQLPKKPITPSITNSTNSMSNRNFRIIIFPSPIPKIFLLQVSLNLLLPPRFQVYSNRVMSIVIMNTKSSNQQDRNLITPKL